MTLSAGGARLKALALAPVGPSSPSFRVRVGLPRAELERAGVELRPAPLFTQEEATQFQSAGVSARGSLLLKVQHRLRRRLPDLLAETEVTFIQRHVGMLPGLALERRATAGRRFVLDVDDAVWLATLPEAGGHPFAFLKRAANKVSWLAERADVVVAGNEVLAEWLSQYSGRVVVVPSLVDPSSAVPRQHEERHKVVWGWIGSRTTAIHLMASVEILAEAARRLNEHEVELVVVGAGQKVEVPGVTVRNLSWSEDREREVLQEIDLGLMPLPDNQWTRRKCAYKALVYMNAGVPVIADDVGVSAAVVGHEKGGLVAGGREDWIEALQALTVDHMLRRKLGSEARRRAKEDFSVQRWGPVIAAALRGEGTT